MAYFSNLPDVFVRTSSYRQNNVDPYKLAKNIFRRIKIRDELDDVILGFSQYTIKNNQRPDQVAGEIYGSMGLDWVVLLCNNIINVYDDSQVRSLKEMKHIPDSIKLEEENEFTEDLDGIEFTNDIPMDEESDEEGFIDLDEI